MIPIAKPIIGEEEKAAVLEVLNSGMISQGNKVEEFESRFAEFTGTSYGVALNSGTAALQVALMAQGIKAGDEVIVPSFTFIATANAVILAGGKPIFAEIEDETYTLNLENVKEKITKRTRAIIPVHLYGHPADMRAIMEIAHDYKLNVIEDASQAHGAEFHGKKAGSFGTGCFSFYPTKNITTGEGGMITTSSKEIAEKARMIRNHGSKEQYKHEILGLNLRMNEISAAIGICQLEKLEEFNSKRISNAEYLSERLRNSNLIPPIVRKNCKHVFNQYTVRVKSKRNEFVEILNKKGIDTRIYYPIPIHKQPLYRELDYEDRLPVTERVSSEVVSLPVHPSLMEKDLDYIASTINEEWKD